MGALTENEIFSCLSDNFRSAAESCEALARLPKKGPTYLKFRNELKLLEGACRQAAYWRSDSRWLQIGLYMEECHKRAGDWLRGIKQPNGGRRPIPQGKLHPLFVKLAENLRSGQAQADCLRTAKTGTRGPILPKAGPAPHRDTRPVGYTKTPGGIIIPNSSWAA